MAEQNKNNCCEILNQSKEFNANLEIVRESHKAEENKVILGYSGWLKISRCICGHGYIESEGIFYPYNTGDYLLFFSNVSYMVVSESECDTVWECIEIDGLKTDKEENRILVFSDLQMSELDVEKGRRNKFDSILPSLQYIMEHYIETIRISTLAKTCYVSESYFRRVFFECMHVSPSEYINQFRINKACELIKNKNYSMDVIASKVGFQSTATFYRNFKRQKGCKPFQWKNDNL